MIQNTRVPGYAVWMILLLLGHDTRVTADEGMFPVSDIAGLSLMDKGLEISPADIFNPDDTCLIDGICRVNGCTGSFVSSSGLIITNHHCAYRAIQQASSPGNDLLANGFIAADFAAEIPAPGYEVRITESYRDVSESVLAAVTPEMEFAERTRAIEKRRKEIERQSEQDHPGMRAEVAEMFAGKTYVLFHYTFIRDVRLVFAPPSSVGNFGGDVDNWEWPRHTGDFAFMRAYVAPDGSTATWSAENVPWQPRRHIQVAPGGVDVNDFVFLLGYPGRTARHKTAAFLEYEGDVRLPWIVDQYQWQMGVLEIAGQEDREVGLKVASRIRSLANVEKRSRGQLRGMKRAGIIGSRLQAEAELQSFIDSDPQRQQKYGTVIQDIAEVYQEVIQNAGYELNIAGLRRTSQAMGAAFAVVDSAYERQKEDLDRETAWMDRNFDRTRQRLVLAAADWHAPADQQMLDGMCERLKAIEAARQLPALGPLLDDGNENFGLSACNDTQLSDPETLATWLQLTPEQVAALDDPFIELMRELYPEYLRLRDLEKQREGRLSKLYGSLIEVKQEFLQKGFVPDANGTLRMTYGRVEGYSPQDAVVKTPITTLRGVIEKTTGVEPFVTPQRVQDLYRAGDFGSFAHPELGQVPVNILYSTDTTGGNSGSPILNGSGQLVGVNFDRAFEATINDFAWNHNYSRSLGVDIRYVLWITGTVYQAGHLLDEMGIAR